MCFGPEMASETDFIARHIDLDGKLGRKGNPEKNQSLFQMSNLHFISFLLVFGA